VNNLVKIFLESSTGRLKLICRPVFMIAVRAFRRILRLVAFRLMNVVIPERETSGFPDVCTIVVLYDDDATRARAMAACDYLVRQFWHEIELKFHWWRTDFLQDMSLASLAADNAVQADFLILSLRPDHELSPTLEAWFESWLPRRPEELGALVDLTPRPRGGFRDSSREQFLLEVSRRGKFDYLTAMPGTDARPPEDRSSLPGIVDDILGESRPPSHFGLNE